VWTGAPQLPSHGSLFPSPPPPPLRLRAHLRCHLSLSLYSLSFLLSLPLSLPLYRSRFVAAAAAAHGWVALSGSASTHFIFFWVFSSPSPSVCAPVALDISLKPARPDRRFSSSFLLAHLLPQTPFYRAPPLLLSLSDTYVPLLVLVLFSFFFYSFSGLQLCFVAWCFGSASSRLLACLLLLSIHLCLFVCVFFSSGCVFG
jgi:hypothetical protein